MIYSRFKQFFGSGELIDDSSMPFSLVAAASANPTLVKSAPGVVTSIFAIGQVSALRYLKFYDTNKVPTAGGGTPVRRYPIPGSIAGMGIALTPRVPMKFLAGIAFTLVAGTGLDTDTTACAAGDVILTVEYI
jgi:hypothetical protein